MVDRRGEVSAVGNWAVIKVNSIVNSTVITFSRCHGKQTGASNIRGLIRIIREGRVAKIRRSIFCKFCKAPPFESPRDFAESRHARRIPRCRKLGVVINVNSIG